MPEGLLPYKMKAFFIILSALVLTIAIGYFQFLSIGMINTVEWGEDGSDALLVFDKENPADVRMIFVSHSYFGKHMQQTFLDSAGDGLKLKKNLLFTVAAIDSNALSKKAYLDYFAYAHLYIIYCKRELWSPTSPQQ